MLALHKSIVLQSARTCAYLQLFKSRASQNCGASVIRLFSSNTTANASEQKPYEGLKNDPSWEADILRHEKKLDQLLKQGVKPEDLPSHERDRKVDALPHLVFKNKEFATDDSILDSTSKLILGNREPEESCSDNNSQEVTNVDPQYAREDVQEVLTRIHFRCDLRQVYGNTITERKEMPRIRYLTSEQLIEERKIFEEKLKEKIKMPLVMKERKPCDVVLARDDVLLNYEDSNVCFIDISEDKPERAINYLGIWCFDYLNLLFLYPHKLGYTYKKRYIIVREPSGVLRTATWDERDRLLQVYFPREGKRILPPDVFKNENLKNAFDQGLHENLLDRCIVQFAADSPDYIRVFEKVYENVNKQRIYNDLRSTRYYGGLVFYLTKHKIVDDLLRDLLKNSPVEEALDIVQLFVLLHPESRTSREVNSLEDKNPFSIIKAYIENDSQDIRGLSQLLHKHFGSKQPEIN